MALCLQQVALEILRRPDIRAKLTESGFEVTAMPGKEHMARIAREVPMCWKTASPVIDRP